MIKLLSLVHRDASIARERFEEIWVRDFAPAAARLPKLRRYVVNVVTSDSAQQEYDGFAELWFDSAADAQAAFADVEVNAELEALREGFIAENRMFTVAETTVGEAQSDGSEA
jgi:uncharacterized protein (TIGR02118 family)